MAQDTNFLDLYKILGLTPDCELAEFKQAYRRRVGVLHPDRRTHGHNDIVAAERLQQLTTLYSAAITFQRQHGRLPGARQMRAAQPEINLAAREPNATTPYPASRRLLLVLALAVAGWLLWDSWPNAASSSTDLPAATTTGTASDTDSRPQAETQTISIGTDAAVVRQLQGAPILISGNRWDYGPSWIRFEDRKVVDWYNSPVRPLNTVSTQP